MAFATFQAAKNASSNSACGNCSILCSAASEFIWVFMLVSVSEGSGLIYASLCLLVPENIHLILYRVANLRMSGYAIIIICHL